jgi:hypothetical protein
MLPLSRSTLREGEIPLMGVPALDLHKLLR